MNPTPTAAAARWRWTCAALATAASLGASVDAPAESAAVVTVSPSGPGGSSTSAGGRASLRLTFQVVIPPRLDLDMNGVQGRSMQARSNLKGTVVTTVDTSGARPVHTVSIP